MKKNRKNKVPETLKTQREKEKKRTKQKMERIGTGPKNRTTNDKLHKICSAPSWNPSHKCPPLDKLCNNLGNIDTLRDHAERRAITNGKYGTLQKKK